MNDVSTKKPLCVSIAGMSERVGPHIWLPLTQVKEVQNLLDRNRIRYATEENSLSMNGGPYMVFINLRPGTVPDTIQTLLDSLN